MRADKLTNHPVAELFPMMRDGELDELAADIRSRGLIEPVMVRRNVVLDGRNRLKACAKAEVEPRFTEWTSEEDPGAWIVSVNLHRRHLSDSQRALVAARLREHLKAGVQEAGRRKMKGRRNSEVRADRRASSRSAEEAAKALNVSRRSTERAARLLEKGSKALVTAVQRGEVALFTAESVLELPKAEQLSVLRKQAQEKEDVEVRNICKRRWAGDLQGFEHWYRGGADTRRDEAEFLRPIDIGMKEAANAWDAVLTAWLARTRFDVVDLVPEAKAILVELRAVHAKVASIVAALERDAAV